MAAVTVLKSSKAALKLNAGTNPDTGKTIVKTDTLPALIADPDPDDIIAVKNAAAPVLNYPVGSIEHTVVKVITEE